MNSFATEYAFDRMPPGRAGYRYEGPARRGAVKPVADADPMVFIIDAETAAREGLQELLRTVNISSLAFGSVSDFLARGLPDRPSCIVLDVRLPGVSGLAFQEQLARSAAKIPVVFLTGHADIPMTVRAMKAGAIDFLTKPVRDQDILDAVTTALEADMQRRRGLAAKADLHRRYAALTDRERDVMPLVAAGRMNKQIAAELDISESTVKVHRGSIMRKMRARTVPDLVRMVDLLSDAIVRPLVDAA